MLNKFSRTELLIGSESINKLKEAHIAIFGIGGVGGYTVEALVRSGVGTFTLVDDDKVCLTNINRQLMATTKTVGKVKVEITRDRILEINPQAIVNIYQTFVDNTTIKDFDFSTFDYIVDAIDTVSAKLLLIEKSNEANVPIISCMGAGNKLDATRFEVSDIYKTSVCPLAKVMRKECRVRNIKSLKVVYSKEEAIKPLDLEESSCKNNCICPPDTKRTCNIRRQIPGSISFVPSVAGLIIGGEVIKDLCVI